MTEAEAIALTLAHLRKQFPKRCGKCAREFTDLADYLVRQHRIDAQVPFVELNPAWVPSL